MKLNRMRSLTLMFLGAALLCLASITAFAQGKPPGQVDAMGAKELDGYDIIIVKKPKGKALTPIGDHKGGKFDFGVLPEGTYSLSVQLINNGANNKTYYESRSNTHAIAVTIEGPANGPIKQGWDVKTGKPVTLPGNTAMGKTEFPDEIAFVADGKHAVKVTLNIVNDAPTKNPGPPNQAPQPATPKPGALVQ